MSGPSDSMSGGICDPASDPIDERRAEPMSDPTRTTGDPQAEPIGDPASRSQGGPAWSAAAGSGPGAAMSGPAGGPDERRDRDARKERVIHARVPESLDDEIRRRAGSLGLSVSNLVRNVLQHTFGLVEDIVADGAEIARAARTGRASAEAPPARPRERAPTVLGWQRVRLAVNAVCDRCNALLPRGSEAAIGVVAGGAAPPIRCESCVEQETATEERSDDRA